MNIKEFIAEIESSFESFYSSGDIDKLSIETNVISRLRLFGNNICQVKEKILDIENSMGYLPKDFKSLKLALKVKPIGTNACLNNKEITDSYIYKERIENPAYFDEVNQEYIKSCHSKIITEKITINNNLIDFYYEPQFLSLVSGIKKDGIAVDCLNLHPSIRKQYLHQINIINSVVNTNFSKGQIYVQYNALPTDEEDEILIPEITTGDILTYITQYVKVMIAEDIIANNRNPQGLTQLYPMWKQELPSLKRAAIVESKFAGLGTKWGKQFKRDSQKHTAQFNLPILKF